MTGGVGRSPDLDPRLGWLEAFLSVAHHLDYQHAGNELGIAADNVRRVIRRLEKWSRRTLIDPDGPLELHKPDGEELVFIVIDVLTMFDGCRASSHRPTRDSLVGTRANLRVSDFQAVVDVARYQTYQQIDQRTSKLKNVRRQITAVESVLGRTIFAGRARLEVQAGSEDIVDAASKIVDKLTSFQVSPAQFWINLRRRIRKHQASMRFNINVWKRRKRLSPLAKRDMKEVEEKLEVLLSFEKAVDHVLAEVFKIKIINPPATSAAHIDMDAFYRERESQAKPRD